MLGGHLGKGAERRNALEMSEATDLVFYGLETGTWALKRLVSCRLSHTCQYLGQGLGAAITAGLILAHPHVIPAGTWARGLGAAPSPSSCMRVTPTGPAFT